ncbi:MAG: YigZ family protein, partial [Candidatus Flemingiibacterium sp.]
VVVVTRYFGGILLGTGGLVRAYSAAAKLAIDAAEVVTYESYREFELGCDYSAYQKIDAELPKFGIITDSVEFGEVITLKLAIKAGLYDEFSARLSEMFAGRLAPKPTGERFDVSR